MHAAIALSLLALAAALSFSARAESPSPNLSVAAARAQCRSPQAERGLTPQGRTAIDAALTRWLDEKLSEAPRDIAPEALQTQLTAALGPQDMDGSCVVEPDSRDVTGALSVEVRREGSSLLVHSTVGIACGGDEAAALYAWDNGWRRFWRNHPPSPQRIAQIQAEPATGLVMALSHDEWCTSNWRQVGLRLWRAAPGRTALLLLDRSDFAFMPDVDGPLSGRLEGADLYVEYLAGSIDMARHSRRAIHHYRFADGRLRRLDPFARSPVDFVDEWLSQPWPGATTLTELAARDALERLHALLRGRGGAPTQSGEFQGEPQRCRRDSSLWQVRMSFADLPLRRRDVAFLVRWKEPDRLRLVAARFRPWPDCQP